MVTDEMVSAYQIAGDPQSCRAQLGRLIDTHRLDGFMLNIISPGIESNTALLSEVMSIVRGATDE